MKNTNIKAHQKKLAQILHQIKTTKPDKIPEISRGEDNQYISRRCQGKIFLNKKQEMIKANNNLDFSSFKNKKIQVKSRIVV